MKGISKALVSVAKSRKSPVRARPTTSSSTCYSTMPPPKDPNQEEEDNEEDEDTEELEFISFPKHIAGGMVVEQEKQKGEKCCGENKEKSSYDKQETSSGEKRNYYGGCSGCNGCEGGQGTGGCKGCPGCTRCGCPGCSGGCELCFGCESCKFY